MALYRVPILGQYPWQPSVLALQNAPPASPAKGDRYIVGGVPTGAWTGYAWYIATYDGAAWIFDIPSAGWKTYDIGGGNVKMFNGTAWQNEPVSAHHGSHEAGGSDVIDADTLDGSHAAAFAVATKGVTNGDSHDHNGGDGAQIPEGGLVLSDVTTLDVSTSKHGFCPKAPNDTSKFLRGDGTWQAPSGSGMGYALQVRSTSQSPADGATYFYGSELQPRTSSGNRLYIPKAGAIKAVYFWWDSLGTAGSAENISIYVRVNNTTDTLVQTVGNASLQKLFSNTSLNIAVSQGDYIEIKMVCPTWTTNWTQVWTGGVIYIE